MFGSGSVHQGPLKLVDMRPILLTQIKEMTARAVEMFNEFDKGEIKSGLGIEGDIEGMIADVLNSLMEIRALGGQSNELR
jgi:hypothetical protein